MKEIKIIEFFKGNSKIATRESGLLLRKYIEDILSKNDVIVLNFSGIDMITQSFADEVLGVIIRNKGFDFLKKFIRIKNTNDFVKSTIKFVISYSKKAA